MSSIEFPITESYAGACPDCRFVIPPLCEVSGSYFEHGHVKCSHCGIAVDLWKATLEKVTRLAAFPSSLAALGPRVTHLRFRLVANETIELDLTQHGISEGATILTVIYTPQGGNCFPQETHANMPHRRFRGTKVHLHGLQMRTAEGVPVKDEFSEENISALVLWAPADDGSVPWVYLVDAIEALTMGRLSQAIVPAQAAVEISITPAVRSFLMKYAAVGNIERLLRQELGFSSVLNVVLPLVCALVGAKPVPLEIRGALNSLRKLRNEFVHQGVLPSDVDLRQVRQMVCAAAFGLEYGKYLRRFFS